METVISYYNYWVAVVLLMIGLYAIIVRGNLMKKMIGLAIFQVAVLLFYISIAKVDGASVPIYSEGADNGYHNPLPHVLMLTAIVVGVAVQAVGLALIVRIREIYGTIEEEDMMRKDNEGVKR